MATKIIRTAVDRFAYFGVETDLRPVSKYRWQKDEVDIPGAGSDAAYKTPPIHAIDFKSKWRCIVTRADGLTEVSDEVGLVDDKPAAKADAPPPPAPDVKKKDGGSD